MADGKKDTALGLGARLRSARKARALTLEQAAQTLRLDESVLRSLEDERFETLGAPVFVRGHLKAYARLLGLSEEAVLDAYRVADPTSDAPLKMAREREAPVTTSPGPLSIAAVVGLALLGILLFYVLYDGTAPLEPAAVPAAIAPDEPAADPPEAAVGSAPVAPRGSRLTLEFTGSSWIEIRDRSGPLLTGVQSAGSRQELTGEPPFAVTLGNAPGVRISIDGAAYSVPENSFAPRGNAARFRIDGPLRQAVQ